MIYETLDKPGGLMRTNIPAFRLPVDVLDEEMDQILRMDIDLRLGQGVESMRELLDNGGYDAVFCGNRCAQGQGIEPAGPSRHQNPSISVSSGWKACPFGHLNSIGERVLIIGVGKHCHGLLPHVAAPGSARRQGDGAQAARLLQGFRLGAGGRRRGARGNCRKPLSEGIRCRGRPASRA